MEPWHERHLNFYFVLTVGVGIMLRVVASESDIRFAGAVHNLTFYTFPFTFGCAGEVIPRPTPFSFGDTEKNFLTSGHVNLPEYGSGTGGERKASTAT